jgi:hypothetical protein
VSRRDDGPTRSAISQWIYPVPQNSTILYPRKFYFYKPSTLDRKTRLRAPHDYRRQTPSSTVQTSNVKPHSQYPMSQILTLIPQSASTKPLVFDPEIWTMNL